MNIRSALLAPVIVLSFVVGIGLTMAFNLWETESSKVPATYLSGEFAGEYNPGDIRGSYSFDDIEEAFGVPVEVLAKAFGVTETAKPGDFQAKQLEEIYAGLPEGEVGTDAVRLFTALYIGRPYTPEETTLLPSPALSILKEKLSTADYEALREKSVSLSDIRLEEPLTATEHTENEDDTAIKGKTTFADLLDWGLSREEIEEVLGRPMGSRTAAVRDYLMEAGLEFSEYKTALQALVDSKN
jgi:hypothetical protein